MPTILQVIPALHTGGAERTALDIDHALRAKGWGSIITSAGGRMLAELEEAGGSHVTLPLEAKNPVTLWRNAQKLIAIIKDRKVDLIHARSRAPAWSALIAARKTKIPFVTTYHGAYNEQNRFKAFYNSSMTRADAIIANSGWTADLILSRSPEVWDKITVIHRGTDFSAFDIDVIAPDRLTRLRQAWGIDETDFVVLNLARLTGWKGQTVVIDAASRLTGNDKELRFVLAGDDQGREGYRQQLVEQIGKHNLTGSVLLPGHCDDPAAAMALADIVVVASTEAEAFGRAAVEAGALQKPVIVTRIGAVGETVLAEPEVTADARTGWKVAPGDGAELANALEQALKLSTEERRQSNRNWR